MSEYWRNFTEREWRMLIDNEWVTAQSRDTFTTVNPATEDHLAQVPLAGPADVDAAVQAAQKAFRPWSGRSPRERAERVHELAMRLLSKQDEFGLVEALDCGNPVTAMIGDVRLAATWMEYFVGIADRLAGETMPFGDQSLHYTQRQPFGVVARIIPFNHPLLFAAGKMAAPLIAGNTLVIKPAEQTPLSALLLAEVVREVMPPGVVNIVTGDGPITGDALVTHPGVPRIAFIGSVETGQTILGRAAGSGIKHVTLELGGKNPMIVFPDADLARAIPAAVAGMNFGWCQGQSCGSTSRLLLHESIADGFVADLLDEVRKIRIGLPWRPEVEMGPLVDRNQYDKVMGYVQSGRECANLLMGGGRPDVAGLERGYYVAPTVIAGVTAEMPIAREEIFGPVLSVMTWKDYDEVIAIANAVQYGLTAAVWTRDLNTAHRAATDLEAGYVWVNGTSRHFLGMPYGGFKASGIGREECPEELLSYTQVKSVNVLFS